MPSVRTLAFPAGATYVGVISGGGNVISGGTFSGASTYTGTTGILNGDTVNLTGGDNRLPTTTSLILGVNGGTSNFLNVGATNQTVGALVIPTATTGAGGGGEPFRQHVRNGQPHGERQLRLQRHRHHRLDRIHAVHR